MSYPSPDPHNALGEESLDTEQSRIWRERYDQEIEHDRHIKNRSGITIEPLYTPEDVNPTSFVTRIGYPGAPPYTRGIYPTMHRGRTWSQRQLVGLGTPSEYNSREIGLFMED